MPLFARTAEAFLHSRKPVRTMDDLKGLKLRTAGAWLEISKSLGAASVTTPGPETYPMLERGAIDATEWGTLYENISMGFHKIAKYVIIPGVHQPSAPFELCVNKAAWGKLSDQRQEASSRWSARQVTMESWMRVGAEDAKALKFFRDQGNEIIELSPEVQKATKDMSVKWADEQAAANPWFKKVWESQRAFEKLWENAASYRNTQY